MKESLTLEGLAQRLETLERENERMRSENAALQRKVDTLEGSGTRRNEPGETSSLVPLRDGERASGFEGRVSRRALLGKAGGAAVAALAAAALLPREAGADHYSDDFESIDLIDCHVLFAGPPLFGFSAAVIAELTDNDRAGVKSSNHGGGYGVLGYSFSGTAVRGNSDEDGPAVVGLANGANGTGVEGTGNYGVWGTGRYGVWGESNQAGFHGVTGRNTNTDGTGVRGVTNNTDGRAGVRGEGSTGVWGSSPRTGYSGVYGQHTGSGYGVVGDGSGLSNAGVLGRNPTGAGVRGEGVVHGVHGKTTSGGTGVFGEGGNGYAGAFSGGKAQLRIVPQSGVGRPTSGSFGKGDVYMDSEANLFVCVSSTTTTSAAQWKQISTVVVS